MKQLSLFNQDGLISKFPYSKIVIKNVEETITILSKEVDKYSNIILKNCNIEIYENKDHYIKSMTVTTVILYKKQIIVVI